MVELNYLCPLKIPRGYPLIAQRARRYDNGFSQSMTLDQAVGYLADELKELEADKVTVYCNYERLTVERLRKKVDDDSAVCIEIGIKNKQYHLVCDRWYLIGHNLYALHLAVRAFRNMVKWGIGDFSTLLYGFESRTPTAAQAAIQAAQVSSDVLDAGIIEADWMRELGLGSTSTLDDANAMYRHRAKQAMADESRVLQLNQAIEAARKYFAG